MKFVIQNKEVIAEQVDAGNVAAAKAIDSNAEIGDYCLTLPDQTVEIMSKKMFESLTAGS
jgi:hypothetical protein